MPKHKMTEAELDQVVKAAEQDEKFDIHPILINTPKSRQVNKEGQVEITLNIQRKKVRKDHVVEVLFRYYQEIPVKEIGNILEDAVHLILNRLKCIEGEPPTLKDLVFKYIPELDTPPHCYKFTRHPAKDIEEVDFISDSIVIECKNWAGYTITDSYVDNQILPRFKKYSDPRYRKILLTSASFSSSLESKILNNNIEIFKFSEQITWENFQDILNELLPLIANKILNLNMKLPDVSCNWL